MKSNFSAQQRRFWSLAEKVSHLKYALRACRNLREYFIGARDFDSVTFYEQRIHRLARELAQLEATPA